MKEMPDLICGKAAVGGNYNSTRDNDDGSDEYAAALKLKHIICSTVPNMVLGEIVLFPSATLYGQAVKDVDIMMIGDLKNYASTIGFIHEGNYSEEEVYCNNFCTTIEVKAHSASRIRKEGTNLHVYYSNTGWHNATRQSNEQKVSAMNFFKSSLGDTPYITNILWFTEVSRSELNRILTYDSIVMPSNALPSDFDFKEIIQKLAMQRPPRLRSGRYTLECGFNGRDTSGVTKPLLFFSKAKVGMGELTRRKIEQISDTELGKHAPCFDGDTLNIFRGRAGSGKTIDLIKTAIRLVDTEGARVQILTYNKALVSDIRRLFTFAQLPDMFEERCVSINTMHAYFYALINECLYDGKLSSEDFLQRYPQMLEQMVVFLKSDNEAHEIVKLVCEDNPRLNWDYILIDEAQDWTDLERNLILCLYDISRIIISDGGQQFVRSVSPCDWTVVSNRNNIKLKQCLRQKRNLVRFINLYADVYNQANSKIMASDNLVGGKILVVLDNEKLFQTILTEKNELLKAGNVPYDFLFAVPPSLVEKSEGERRFKLLSAFEQKGILLWDGTNEDNRTEFAVNLEESRVLQYESIRGLEGWSVCCIDFDVYMEYKEQQFNPDLKGSSLLLESAEDRKNKYLLNWALIPLTRAIDTLIITLSDRNSNYSKQLIRLAKQHPDYISII